MSTAAQTGDSGGVDRGAVEELLYVLQDRRLLFGERHLEDELHTTFSSIEIRRELTSIKQRHRPSAAASLVIDEIRAACREFADSAGPNAKNFHPNDYEGVRRYAVALKRLRVRVGEQLARLEEEFDIQLSDELAAVRDVHLEARRDADDQ